MNIHPFYVAQYKTQRCPEWVSIFPIGNRHKASEEIERWLKKPFVTSLRVLEVDLSKENAEDSVIVVLLYKVDKKQIYETNKGPNYEQD